LWITPVELPEKTAGESHGVGVGRQAIVNPLTLWQPLEKSGLTQDLEVPRHPRLALLQRLGEIRNAQRTLGTQREEPQAAGLTRSA
jgi:hypothetical protein